MFRRHLFITFPVARPHECGAQIYGRRSPHGLAEGLQVWEVCLFIDRLKKLDSGGSLGINDRPPVGAKTNLPNLQTCPPGLSTTLADLFAPLVLAEAAVRTTLKLRSDDDPGKSVFSRLLWDRTRFHLHPAAIREFSDCTVRVPPMQRLNLVSFR